jgi:hypothetical protein
MLFAGRGPFWQSVMPRTRLRAKGAAVPRRAHYFDANLWEDPGCGLSIETTY